MPRVDNGGWALCAVRMAIALVFFSFNIVLKTSFGERFAAALVESPHCAAAEFLDCVPVAGGVYVRAYPAVSCQSTAWQKQL